MTDPHRMEAGHAPTPFSADEIRAGCQPTRTIRLRVEPGDGEPFIRVNRFLEADAEGALQEGQRFTLDGTPLGEASVDRVTWRGFQSHASYPEAVTTITDEEIELPAGRFACWCYTLREGEGERRFWFAKELPGMPVKVEERVAGELTYRMLLLENVPGGRVAP